MAAFTRAQILAKIDECLAAETKVLEMQAYTIGGRAGQRAQLEQIGERLNFWRGELTKLDRAAASGGLKMQQGVPC